MTNFRIPEFRELIKLQFVKFLLVGFINSIFGYGCFALFLYIGLHYTLAVLLATICGVIFNFKSTGTLVFGSYDNRRIFLFIRTYVIIYFINIAGIQAFSYIGIGPYIGGAILILPMALLGYILNKRFVFNCS
jgi:putative flippase GtrA